MAAITINTEDIQIPASPPGLAKLRDLVKKPEDLDGAVKKLGLAPNLLNLHFATVVDLSWLGLGRRLYIPVQIADREGGRKSLYFLATNEEVLAGVYVIDRGILLRYIKRTSGSGTPAKSGDMYSQRLATLQGKTLVEAQGPLEVIDAATGQGSVRLSIPDSDIEAGSELWIMWSMFYEKKWD